MWRGVFGLMGLAGCNVVHSLDYTSALGTTALSAPERVRADRGVFVWLGDTGRREGDAPHPTQARVARGVRSACAARGGCDAVFLAGDNLYMTGLKGDPEERELKEKVLEAMVHSYGLPVYAVLGNHDWDFVFSAQTIARRELDWIAEKEGVQGDTHFWWVEAGPVTVWGLDTNYLQRNPRAHTHAALADWLARIDDAGSPWTIALGHHTLLSNGSHGNWGDRFRPARSMRKTFGDHVLGVVDLYVSGHDHNVQFFPEAGTDAAASTAVLVSGAGSKCTPPGKRPENPLRTGVEAVYEHYDLGFAILEADPERLVLSFHDADGAVRWQTHRGRDTPWSADGAGFRTAADAVCAEADSTPTAEGSGT